jgi:hypothetical protein
MRTACSRKVWSASIISAASNTWQRYLNEFSFRYSNRSGLGVSDGERAALAIKGAEGKRLTYRPAN